jgi:DNA-directed RNA polymerase subunit H (RpoH/RPB5)
MNLLLETKIENLFRTKDFTDKETGIVTPSKWKIQTFDNIETESGEKMQLVDISITDATYQNIKDKVGTVVKIPVRTFTNKGRVGYYGI